MGSQPGTQRQGFGALRGAEPMQPPQLLAASGSPGAAALLPGRNVRLFAFCWLHGGFGVCTGEDEEQAAQTLCADASAHVRVCHKSGCFGADITTNGETGGTAPGVSVSGACHNADPQAARCQSGHHESRRAGAASPVAVGQLPGCPAQPPCLHSLLSACPVWVLHGIALLPDLIFGDLRALGVPCLRWLCGTPCARWHLSRALRGDPSAACHPEGYARGGWGFWA